MRNLIIGVAAAVMAMAAPGIASADTRATIGAQYTNLDSDTFSDNVDVFGLSGAFNYDFSNGWTVQGDATSNRADVGGSADLGFSYSALNFGMRTDSHAVYGWVGLADGSALPSVTHIGIGGQMYLSNITLEASLGYADIDGLDSNPVNVSVDGTYFLNDNLGLSARVSHTDTDGGFGGIDDFTSWGVGAEYRFADSPFSVNVAYNDADTSPDNIQAWSIGVKMDLGSDSLMDRSQHGPSWNGARSLFNDILGGL